MTNNIGEIGSKSIRIDGQRISELPIGQGNEAKDGLPGFLKTDRENKASVIRAKYPTQNADYLKASIRECENNIVKIKEFKLELKGKISEYQKMVSNCEFREREMALYDAHNPNDFEAMKGLRLKYPPYDIEAMNKQIYQFQEAVERSDDVIEKDYNSISEIKQVLALVEQRDRELLNIT